MRDTISNESPQQLFDELFQNFIEQSRKFIIKYDLKEGISEMEIPLNIKILSVNGCSSAKEFKRKMIRLINSSIDRSFVFFENTPLLASNHIDHFLKKLHELHEFVIEETSLIQDQDDTINKSTFKTFKNCKYEGPTLMYSFVFSQQIRLQTSQYANDWSHVLNYAINELTHLDGIFTALAIESALPKVDSKCITATTETENFKPKLQLSVSNLGLLVKLMTQFELIEIPARNTPSLMEWCVNTFKSKKCDSITTTSMRKNYFDYYNSIEYWIPMLTSMIDWMKDEREHHLK